MCISTAESAGMSESHVRLPLKPVTSENLDGASFGHRCVSSPWLGARPGPGWQGWSFVSMREEEVFPGKRDSMGQALR